MDDVQRTNRILNRIFTLTSERNLNWESGSAAGSFLARLGGSSVQIASEDGDDVAPFRFSVLGPEGDEVTALRSISSERRPVQERNQQLSDLYNMVRSQVLGIDDVLHDVEQQLGL